MTSPDFGVIGLNPLAQFTVEHTMKYATEDPDSSGKCAWTAQCGGRAIGLVRMRVACDSPKPFYVDVPVCERCKPLTLLPFTPYKGTRNNA